MSDSSEPRDQFLAHVERVRAKYLPLNLSETDTRSYLVTPVLRLLGYTGVEHLRQEVPVPATREFIDYELLVDGQPYAIVEAKAIRHAITEQHAAQRVQSASVLGVRWCLITNGITWALYDAHVADSLEKKGVAEVRLDGDAAAVDYAWSVLSLFSREAVAAASPLTTLLIERVLEDELLSPNAQVVQTLRRAVRKRFGERVTGDAIVEAVHAWRGRITGHAPVPGPDGPEAGEAEPITLQHLIDAGLLPAAATLEARVQGVSHVARLRDGTLELKGVRYATPSAASRAVRNVKSWNGWRDWRYKEELLDDLRRRLRSQRASEA